MNQIYKMGRMDVTEDSSECASNQLSSQNHTDEEEKTYELLIPSFSDLCCIYSAWPLHVSYLNHDGSWLIQEVDKEFSKNAHIKSLNDMIIAVRIFFIVHL